MEMLEFASINYEVVNFRFKDDAKIYKAWFTSLRVDARSVPMGYYKYDIRGTDDDGGGSPVSINKNIWVNHFGTIICNEWLPVPMDEGEGEMQIENFQFTDEQYTPDKVIYGIVFVDYDQFAIGQLFAKWSDVLEAYKSYCAREDMFEVPEVCGYRINAFFLQNDATATMHKPKYINYIATPEHGLDQVNDLWMSDEYLSKPAYESAINIYCNALESDNNDKKMLSYSVEMVFSISTEGLDDFAEANRFAEGVFANYLVKLKDRGIDFNELYKIDMINKLKEIGFVQDSDDEMLLSFKLGEFDGNDN